MTQPISNRYMKSKTFVDIHKSSKSQRTATWHGFVARESSERCGFLTKSLQTRWQVHRRRDTRCLRCDGCQRFRDTHCHHWPESGGSVPNCSHDGTPLCLKHLSHHWFRASLSNTLKPAKSYWVSSFRMTVRASVPIQRGQAVFMSYSHSLEGIHKN